MLNVARARAPLMVDTVARAPLSDVVVDTVARAPLSDVVVDTVGNLKREPNQVCLRLLYQLNTNLHFSG